MQTPPLHAQNRLSNSSQMQGNIDTETTLNVAPHTQQIRSGPPHFGFGVLHGLNEVPLVQPLDLVRLAVAVRARKQVLLQLQVAGAWEGRAKGFIRRSI